MRIVIAVVFGSVAFALAAISSSAAIAQSEQEKPPVKRHHVKRPDPENATMPEKKDWISQTLGDVLDGIDDLGKPLQEQPR